MRDLVERYRAFVTCLRDLEQARPQEPSEGFDVYSFRRPLVEHIQSLNPQGAVGLGGDERRMLQRVQYAMAVLADEVMTVGPEWAGTNEWSQAYLESKFAGTEEGGDRIFDTMEEILRRRDPSTFELANIYLLTLSLGFRGHKASAFAPERLQEEEQHRADLARRLYMFAAGKSPLEQLVDDQLFPSAFEHTERVEKAPRHVKFRSWALIFVVSLVVCGLVSTLMWTRKTAGIVELVESIRVQADKLYHEGEDDAPDTGTGTGEAEAGGGGG